MPEAVLKELGDVTAWSSIKGKDIKCTSLRALQEVNEKKHWLQIPPDSGTRAGGSAAWLAAFLGENGSLGTRSWYLLTTPLIPTSSY